MTDTHTLLLPPFDGGGVGGDCGRPTAILLFASVCFAKGKAKAKATLAQQYYLSGFACFVCHSSNTNETNIYLIKTTNKPTPSDASQAHSLGRRREPITMFCFHFHFHFYN